MWCATGVNLSGGVTKDGGEIVGASVFYNNNNNNNMEEQPISKNTELGDTIDDSLEMKKLDEELKVIFCFNSIPIPNYNVFLKLIH